MNENAPYNASDIARWFLWRNQMEMEKNGADYISNLKLQKLLYYAQGSYLALTDRPLFREDLEAWTHGPVVKDIYHEYKLNGANGIEYENLSEAEKAFSDISNEDANILESVYQEFGQYSAWKLRNMTHEETPWLEAYNILPVINIDTMTNYFRENYVEA